MKLKASRQATALFERNKIRIQILKARLSENGISEAEHSWIKEKLRRARKRVDELMGRCSNSTSIVKGD